MREKTALHKDITDLIKSGLKDAEIIKALSSTSSEINASTVHYLRNKLSRPVEPKRGRKRWYSETVEEKSSQRLQEDPSVKTLSQVIEILDAAQTEERLDNNLNPYFKAEISTSTKFRAARRIAPDISKNPKLRTAKRDLAMNDIFNGIAQATMAHAIQNVPPLPDLSAIYSDSLRIHPSCLFNFDAVSCDLNGEIIASVRMASGTKKLRELKQSSAVSTPDKKHRSVKQLYLTSADGFLHAAIVIIKDHKIQTLQLHHIADQGGYQLWVVFSPTKCGRVNQEAYEIIDHLHFGSSSSQYYNQLSTWIPLKPTKMNRLSIW